MSEQSPVERFRLWWKNNHVFLKEMCEINHWQIRDVWAEGPAMATWVLSSGAKGNKKHWGRFVANWMRTYYRNKSNAPVMTAAQEDEHYASKRRHSESATESIGEIIEGLTKR